MGWGGVPKSDTRFRFTNRESFLQCLFIGARALPLMIGACTLSLGEFPLLILWAGTWLGGVSNAAGRGRQIGRRENIGPAGAITYGRRSEQLA
jgi:hypothetical protein